ncbi:MAG: SDR family NAD(P)-dependent oxidoreductase [Burkholderiaceae bacterium]
MRVLITGASRGIGRAVALRLAAEGARVAACASAHGDELDQLVAEIRAAGGIAVALLGDLQQSDTPARLVEQATAALGGLDAVVGNAGISRPAALVALDGAEWDRVFNVNVRAQWLLARAAHPWLQRSRGSLVAVASMSGVQPYSGMGAYSASKAALIMLVRQLAQEWAADGIRVNCVSPGLVRTPLTQPMYDISATKAAREALVPLHRIAEADADMAGLVAFLLGPDAGYLTGHNLLADGGLLDSVQTHIAGRPRSGG